MMERPRLNPYRRYTPTMKANRSKRRRPNSPPRVHREPAESRASEVVTVAWTVSVTGVFIADLIVVAAHLFARNAPAAEGARLFGGVMLLAAALMGAVSLALLAIVWHTRRVKPPRGYVAFAVLVAAAPIAAALGRLLR